MKVLKLNNLACININIKNLHKFGVNYYWRFNIIKIDNLNNLILSKHNKTMCIVLVLSMYNTTIKFKYICIHLHYY